MFSLFKYIDVNIVADPINAGKNCVWFTIPIAATEEIDEESGKTVNKYEYLFFPSSASDGEFVSFKVLDSLYYPSFNYGYMT